MAIDAARRKIVSDFGIIEAAAKGAVVQLRNEGSWSRRTKAKEIENAVHRLALLIMKRHNIQGLDVGTCAERLDSAQVADIQDGRLDGLRAMLDCEVSVLRTWTSHGDITYGDPDVDHEAYLPQSSIRKALNASRNHILFWMNPTIGPLWGKADTLIQFEQEVFPKRK